MKVSLDFEMEYDHEDEASVKELTELQREVCAEVARKISTSAKVSLTKTTWRDAGFYPATFVGA